MQLVAYIRSAQDLSLSKANGVKEVLLGHRDLSAQGNLGTEELTALAKDAQAMGVRAVLLWDTLMRDEEIDRAIKTIEGLDLSLFDAVRVLDPGAIEYALSETKLPLQVILKTGNHNFVAIENWCDYVGDRLEKVVISSELPKTKLAQYTTDLAAKKIGVEVLGLGPILLFYTPRYLLTYQSDQDLRSTQSSTILSAMASCDENTHKGFRLIETKHGTLMFHAKDYCLVDRIPELKAMGLAGFLVDFRQEETFEAIAAIGALMQNYTQEAYQEFITSYTRKVTQCFYNANATDVLFKKLKNTITQRKDDAFIGEVIETQKRHHMVIQVMGKDQKLVPGIKLRFITPMGKMVETVVGEIRNLDGQSIAEVKQGEYAVLPPLSSVSPTTVVYQTLQ